MRLVWREGCDKVSMPPGDTGAGDEVTEGEYVKESDYTYTLWCSGRHNCNGMLVQLQVS